MENLITWLIPLAVAAIIVWVRHRRRVERRRFSSGKERIFWEAAERMGQDEP